VPSPPLRLDYVSPLPPVRSGIADYSADLLPLLAAHPQVAELRLVRLPDQAVAEELAATYPLLDAAEWAAEATGDRLALYQMGNNPYHEAVLELALERPGVLVLHDLVLHHLLVERTLSRGVLEPYVEQLERDHGWVGRAVATTRRWGGYTDAGVFALPAHRTLLRRQRGVLVHSAWAAGMIAEEDAEIAVRTLPMGVPLPPAAGPPGGAAARAARRALGLPEEAPLLGSFGFQTPIKRTAAAVRALARPQLAGAHLLVVGEVSPQVDLVAAARRAGVAGRVHVTGFVDYALFEQALAACDLALNLRYPTAGETSASLLRLLAAGRPALVSDYAQFRDLPSAAVVRVPLGDGEEEALAAAAAALLADRPRLQAMGEAARRHVAEEHAPERAAAAMVAACGELAALAPPGDRAALAPPPTTAAWDRLRGEVSLELDGAELGAGGTGSGAGSGGAGSGSWRAGERRRLTLRLCNGGACRWLAARRGPGGVAFRLSLLAGGRDVEAERPWIPLPRDLAPGEETTVTLELRRPPGPARLRVEPLILNGWSGSEVSRPAAPCWEGVLE